MGNKYSQIVQKNEVLANVFPEGADLWREMVFRAWDGFLRDSVRFGPRVACIGVVGVFCSCFVIFASMQAKTVPKKVFGSPTAQNPFFQNVVLLV